MSWFQVDYASPSAFDASSEAANLQLSADARRPVRFVGTVREHLPILRFALRALGEAIWSDEASRYDEDSPFVLDPVITVHPDRLYFEAFSQDESSYVRLGVDPAIFDIEGAVSTGTTNIDFSAWLWGALGEMRSSRETRFSIAAGGVSVETRGGGGRFEQKVSIPKTWVQGFLQVQSAMTLPGTRLSVRPVDLLAAVRYLRMAKAKVSPRALRYEMAPGVDARIVLEPWEHVVPLVGCTHGYTEQRTIRTWGRQRLKLIESLLPFATRADIYLKGRALPAFYVLHLPGMEFMLGLTGFAGQKFSRDTRFDLAGAGAVDPALALSVLAELARDYHASAAALAERLQRPLPAVSVALDQLTADGRAFFDPERREYRHRELFAEPIRREEYFPPDPRLETARALLANGEARLDTFAEQAKLKQRRFKDPNTGETIVRDTILRDFQASGQMAGQAVEITLNDEGRIIFGHCGCPFFQEHLFNRGPCAHMFALFELARGRLGDPA